MSRKLSESKKEELLRSRGQVYGRVPLKDVVADCERRWFETALKAAQAGDVAMQSLVGQMLCSGYGVPLDMKKWAKQLISVAWTPKRTQPTDNVYDY